MNQAAADGGGSMTATTTTAPLLLAGLGLGPLGLIGELAAGIGTLVMTMEDIGKVQSHLDMAASYLDEAQVQMATLPHSAVGGSAIGAQLVHHAGLANDRLVDTLTEMKTGVASYRESIQAAMTHITSADESTQSTAKKGEACIGDGTMAPAPSSCGGA